ncbi:hypothetical protein C8A03DRAFT_36850 [Achaetomium macrosporum]|uniref:Uncharacterized protein n=1 Tax=Achaetomium macrosporum TaxID=79813 RepID=A0AAN7C4X9_9PEZI|nr:hypothetical protein C8A03DRAFT_36850 [Achaetomium macrosporum]
MSGEQSGLSWVVQQDTSIQAVVQSFIHRSLNPDLPAPPSKLAATRPCQQATLRPPERKCLADTAPGSVQDAPLSWFDPGIFDNGMVEQKLYATIDSGNLSLVREPDGNIMEHTYAGTQLVLVQAYSLTEET